VGSRHLSQFVARFTKRHVQAWFALGHTLQEELERERGLSCARVAFNQQHSVARKPSFEDLVETCDSTSGQVLGD
jgi:hypothetical protein